MTELTVVYGGRKRSFGLGGDVRIGSDPTCEIVVVSPHVADVHVVVRHDDRGWVAIGRGSGGTFRGGHRITELRLGLRETLILGDPRHGESIELLREHPSSLPRLRPVSQDDEATEVTPRRRRPEREPRSTARNEPDVVSGPELFVRLGGDTLRFAPPSLVTVGRHPDNDVVVSNPTASRHHAVVHHDADGWTIEALSDASPTWVQGRQLTSQRLVGSTEVLLGDPVTGERLILAVGQRAETQDELHLGPIVMSHRAARLAVVTAMVAVVIGVLFIILR